MNRNLKTLGKLGATCASIALLAGGLALEAGAMEPEQPEQPTQPTQAEKPAFDKLDADRDGQITPDEARETWLAAVFHNVDVDSDGAVNRAEYDSALS
jgi:hypothetical protein